MEAAPTSPAAGPERGYRIPEIAELEGDTKKLVEKLKGKIDENYYTLLVSDEVGGRIPTLIVRKVMSLRHPGQVPHTTFVNGGKMLKSMSMVEGEEGVSSLGDYLSLSAGAGHRVLVVTQVVDSGESLGVLVDALRRARCSDVDVASVRSLWGPDKKGFRGESAELLRDADVFIGADSFSRTSSFDAVSAKLGGVAKPAGEKGDSDLSSPPEPPYTVHPRPYVEVLEESGRGQFQTRAGYAAAMGFEAKDDWRVQLTKTRERRGAWEDSLVRPVDDAERAEAARAVADARADVNLMAEKIVREVWGEDAWDTAL